MQYICGNALNKNLKDHIDRSKAKLNKEIAYTINTKQDRRCGDANFILDGYGETTIKDFLKMKQEVVNTFDEYNHKINGNETIGTIQAMYPVPNHGHRLIIRNANSKGYLEATVGDGIDISSRMQYHRGTVQKGKTQTLSTMGGENNGVVVIGNYTPSNYNASRIVDNEYSAPTVMENHSTITATQTNDLRIRKLTPYECFALMGVKRKDYEKVAKNQSDSSLYHLAGDSIVVDVLMAIFREMI